MKPKTEFILESVRTEQDKRNPEKWQSTRMASYVGKPGKRQCMRTTPSGPPGHAVVMHCLTLASLPSTTLSLPHHPFPANRNWNNVHELAEILIHCPLMLHKRAESIGQTSQQISHTSISSQCFRKHLMEGYETLLVLVMIMKRLVALEEFQCRSCFEICTGDQQRCLFNDLCMKT